MTVAEPSTFVKVDRNILKWRWFQNPNTLAVWLWLILSANIEDHDFMKDTIHRGEVATSRRRIMTDTGLSEQQVRTALNHLKATGEITVRHGANYQVITLVCYDQYQSVSTGKSTGDQPGINRRSTGDQPQSKKVRTTRTGRKEESLCSTNDPPELSAVAAYFAGRGRSQADAEKFYRYNKAKGWRQGKTKITDWEALADMWIGIEPDIGSTIAEALDEWGRPIPPRYE